MTPTNANIVPAFDRPGSLGVQLPDWKAWLKANRSKAAKDDRDYELHLAAHEWSLSAALDINRPEDFRSLPSPRIEPFEHQVQNAILFFRRLSPRGLIADDVGLGKTITAGLIARELLTRGRIESILVVSPKSLLEQWQEELESKFGIKARAASGAEFNDLDSWPVWITSYTTAKNRMDAIRARKFDLLVLDEAHTLRNLYGTNGAPQVAVAFQKLMQDDAVRFCLMLTATPIQNRLWDIFSLMEILKAPQPNPLGTETHFGRTFVAGSDARRIAPGSQVAFRKLISEATVRTRRADTNLLFPKREVRDQLLQPLPEEREFIDEALQAILAFPPLVQMTYARSLMSSPWALAESLERKAAESPYGSPLKRRFEELAKKGRSIRDSAKVQAVLKLAEAAPREGLGGRIIVFTQRLATVRHLYSALNGVGLGAEVGTIQGGEPATNLKAIREFQADPPKRRILLAMDVGAVGLNLQAGNIVVNYDLPWNPMVIEQRIGRVQRLGQRAQNVIVYNLVLRGTIEDLIVRRLMEKLELFSQAIGEMEELLELCGFDEEHRSLENVIMDLIRKAGEQRDIAEDLRRAEVSRRKAKERLEEMRRATEDALASIRPMDDGPVLAGLIRSTPRMELRELVLGCLKREKAEVRPDNEGRLFGRRPDGSPVELVIDRQADVVDDPGVQLVAPGTKFFERVVKNVRDGVIHHLKDVQGYGLDRVAEALDKALKPHGLVVERLVDGGRKSALALRLTTRITAAVSTDRFETLLDLELLNEQHGVRSALTAIAADPKGFGHAVTNADGVDLEADLARAEPRLRALVTDEPSVARFCSFYRDRYEEELEKLEKFARFQGGAGNNPYTVTGSPSGATQAGVERAMQSLQFRFTPTRRVDVVGLSGMRYDLATVQAFVRNRSQRGSIPILIEAVPVSGVVLSGLPALLQEGNDETIWACPGGHLTFERSFIRCSREGCASGGCNTCREKNVEAVGLSSCPSCEAVICQVHSVACEECGARLCDHHEDALTETGEISCPACRTTLPDGRTFRTSQLVKSEVSGLLMPVNEASTSQASGSLAAPGELVACEVSGALVLPTEVVRCEVTGKRVRRDLTEASALSGRRALRDKLVRSEFSKRWALPDESVLCDESGALLLLDEVESCSVTKRVAQSSLFEEEDVLGERVLRRLLKQSDVSRRWALPENLVGSAKTGRVGLPREVVHCPECDADLLADEATHCPETSRDACPEHFVESQKTGARVLPEALGTCEETSRRVEHRFLGTCAESGKRVVSDLLTKCEESGRDILPACSEISAVSGKRVRKSLLISCEVSGERALPAELEQSAISGKRVLPRLLVTCPESGKRLLESETVVSGITGALLAPEAAGTCEETGVRVEHRFLGTCAESGKRVLATKLVKCAETGEKVLPAFTGVSVVSGRRVRASLLATCDVTGERALPAELERCAVTGKASLPRLMATCAETGKRLLESSARRSSLTGEILSPEAIGRCEATGQTAKRSLLGRDEVSGQMVLSHLLRPCEVSGRRTLAANLETCTVSGKQVLPALLDQCEETGRKVLPALLGRCALTGRDVHPDQLVRCSETGRTVLRREAEVCAETGEYVARDMMGTCSQTAQRHPKSMLAIDDLSGETVASRLLVECAATHVRTTLAHLGQSKVSGKLVQSALLVHCEETGAAALPGELTRCECSGRLVLQIIAGKCQFSGRTVLGRLLLTSAVSGMLFAPDRRHDCALCGAMVDVSEGGRCVECGTDCCRAELRGGICSACKRLRLPKHSLPLTRDDLQVLRQRVPWVRAGSRVDSARVVHVSALGSRLAFHQRRALLILTRSHSKEPSPLGELLRLVPLDQNSME